MLAGTVGSTREGACIYFPAGSYASSSSAPFVGTENQMCTKCAAGKYKDSFDPSFAVCVDCLVGHTSAEGSFGNTLCGYPAGMKTVDSSGTGVCSACAVSKYKSIVGVRNQPCVQCLLGKVAYSTSATSCRTLQFGYYAKDGVQALRCPISDHVVIIDALTVGGLSQTLKGRACESCHFRCNPIVASRNHWMYNYGWSAKSFQRYDPCSLACLNADDAALTAVIVVTAVGFFGLFFHV
jgi:hypothetical protein